MEQSKIFLAEEADKYFERNKSKRTFLADYVLSLFAAEQLAKFDIAEFGAGGGQNLLFLKEFAQRCHGFDGSPQAIKSFNEALQTHPQRDQFYAKQVNLCEPFETPLKYDLVIYGFFAYYLSDPELKRVKQNLMAALKPGGYLFVYDFFSRSCYDKPDSHNTKLRVFKRNLAFWSEHFSEFTLVDFRLFDNKKITEYRANGLRQTVDPTIPADDDQWNFGGLFQLMSKS